MKPLLPAILALTLASATGAIAAPTFPLSFDFGLGAAAPGSIAVTPQTTYSAERGYGFENADAIRAFGDGRPDALRGDGCTASAPFYFSVAVPAGNYRVRVTLGDGEHASQTTIKAEARRWMRSDVTTAPSEWKTEDITVAVKTPLLETGDEIGHREGDREWDDRLTLEFAGSDPRVCAVEIEPVAENVPTVFIVGDSTVTNQREAPRSGWGQMLPQFFGSNIVIANHAEGGESLLRFAQSKRLQKVLERMRPGDWMLIQFGHNDQKKGQYYVEPFGTYQTELMRYANLARERGATPVFVTSPHRRTFTREGAVRNTLAEFPAAMRDLAAREQIPLLDLNADSEKWLAAMGPQNSVQAYSIYPANSFPGQTEALNDNTHYNERGALELAGFVAAEIREKLPTLAPFLVDSRD